MTLTRERKKAAKSQRQGSPGEDQIEQWSESTGRKKKNPPNSKKTSHKSLIHNKKEGYKITDFLITKMTANPIKALNGTVSSSPRLAIDSETMAAVAVKSPQDTETPRVDTVVTNSLNPYSSNPGLTINAEIQNCYQFDSFFTLNLNNWSQSSTSHIVQPLQEENDTDCIMMEDHPLIDLSETCSDTF
ncbi:hypothetical protein NDU88_001919 [Pleurodeles waltl]|uniref:Uncharacterized protein n=1 Tax=Pleurodeles waltl TaxID=8319 RepID=A0AAV7R9D3_PLEWA|nr:hypothetical protein NDU88_001919 [Pleurodeles waltl]